MSRIRCMASDQPADVWWPTHAAGLRPASKLWLLSTSAIALEIGVVVALLHAHVELWQIPVVMAAFHCGYLISGILTALSQAAQIAILASSGVALGLSLFASPHVIVLAVSMLAFSAVVQNWRRELKSVSSTNSGVKNLGKALGMLSAAVFALPGRTVGILAALLVLSLVVLARPPYTRTPTETKPLAPHSSTTTFLLLAESLHHAHYFAYAYTFWALTTIPASLVAPCFLLGWVGYFAAERLLREHSRTFWPRSFVAGHLVCALALATIAAQISDHVTLFAWFMTGIGGGTAYTLGNATTGSSPARERFEDAGHVLGCGIGAATAAIATVGPVIAAAMLAVGTALTMSVQISFQPGRGTS